MTSLTYGELEPEDVPSNITTSDQREQNSQVDSNIYMNDEDRNSTVYYYATAPGDNRNAKKSSDEVEPVYSLAEPVDDEEVVVVDNELYDTS